MRSAIFIWSIGLLMFSVTLMVRVGAVFDSFFDDMTGDEGYINGFIEEYQLGTISPGSFTGVPLHIDYYILKKTKDYITKYEPEELMAELSKPMEPIEDTTGPYKISVGKQVAELLAATRDKSRANTILGQFSVDDLLSLNRIHSSECVLTVRDKKWKPICDKIHEAGHKNLELYCKKTLNNLKDCCVFSRFFIMGQELRKMGKRKEAIKFLTLVGNVVKFDRKVEKRKRKKEVKRREAARKKLEAERERIRKELNEDDNRDSVQDDNLAYDVAIAVENVSQEMLTEYYKKVLKAVFEHEGESYENEIRSICEKMTNTMRDKYGIVDDDIIPINKYMITFTRFSKHCQIILTKLPKVWPLIPPEPATKTDGPDGGSAAKLVDSEVGLVEEEKNHLVRSRLSRIGQILGGSGDGGLKNAWRSVSPLKSRELSDKGDVSAADTVKKDQ